MKYYYPHYYDKFNCIADKCKDSCCIGWEIDIDDNTLEMYGNTAEPLKTKLRTNITTSDEGTHCFRLTENERCPFLNDKNLCELILAGGEDMLCEICHMHPRFVNWLPDRCETGLGLCCEEAARIILTDTKPLEMTLTAVDNEEEYEYTPDAAFLMKAREYIFKTLEIIHKPSDMMSFMLNIGNVIQEKLNVCDYSDFSYSYAPLPMFTTIDTKTIELVKSLEPLNEEWKNICSSIENLIGQEMSYDDENSTFCRNLINYYVLRYFMNSAEDMRAYEKAALSVFSVYSAKCIIKATGMNFIDAACLWSKETEYSEENMEMILNFLDKTKDNKRLNCSVS